ncbi:MAG: serine hydrolase [Bacteroidota bacterium]|nr:serine hydrolase [Bacteroidota bacterium]
MRFIKTFIFFLLISVFAFSQGMSERERVEESFVLLRNNNNVVPFVNLAKQKICLNSTFDSCRVLLNSMNRYTTIFPKAENANLTVYAVLPNQKYDETILKSTPNIVLCVFGDASDIPNNIEDYKNIKAIIYSPFSDSLTLDYCGQLLFGGIGAKGKLFTSISDVFKLGDGIVSKGNIRFKYTIPAELGLDSVFIFQKIDSIANFAVSVGATPGCEIFVAKNQKVFLHKSYGFHTYDSIVKVKNTDLYDLASITKIAASAPSLMLLNQNDKIDLKDKFSKYWCPFIFSNKNDLTFLDAMCHQGQLYPWIPFWKNTLDENKELSSKIFSKESTRKFSVKVAENLFINKKYVKQIYREIKKSELLEEKKYKYSDLSFYIYPEIVEKISNQSFDFFLNENFYSKLGANTLIFNPLSKYSKKQIVPTEYDKFYRKQLLHGYVHDEGASMLGGISGHAGLFGNANDLAKLMQMYLNYGEYGDLRYINEEVLRQWTSYQFRDNNNRRGIIFDKPLLTKKGRGTPSPSASDLSFGHSGFTGTFAWVDPQNGLLFIFLSNRVYPTRANKKLLKYNIRTNIHQVFYDAIEGY